MNTDRVSDDESANLQNEIDRLSAELGVRSMPVGFRTRDGLNIYIADDGSYHFTFYERGKLGFDQAGNLDDPHPSVERQCHDVADAQRVARSGNATAVEPDMTGGHKSGSVSARADTARVPQPFVDALAAFRHDA